MAFVFMASDITTAKERMLKKIRKALLNKRPNPYPQLEDQFVDETGDELPEVLFAEKFTTAGGQFVFCEDEIQFIENLLLLAEERNWHKIYCWEPPLQQLLDTYEFPYYATDKAFLQAEAGFTLCEALIAQNGTILVSNAHAGGRKLSVYPPVHIVLAYTSQIAEEIKDGLDLLQKKYGKSMPSSVSFITGKSRAYNVGESVQDTAFGPKETFIFLLDG